VFSDDRCGLLEHAPAINGELTPDAIRNGFIANLEAAAPAEGTPAAVLLANLKNANDLVAHKDRVNKFLTACDEHGSRKLIELAHTITSLNRSKARERPIIEFEATMPVDNLKVNPASRLGPGGCGVVEKFIP
jgi:hypothetical protein